MEFDRNLRIRKDKVSYKGTSTHNKTSTNPSGKGNLQVKPVPLNATQHRISLTKRTSTSTTPNALNSTHLPSKARLSAAQPVNSSPASLNNTVAGKIQALEARIKSIEDNSSQESRFHNIETTFDQIRSENQELQLTIVRLKSDIESLQFVTSHLCEIEFKLRDSEDCVTRLNTENAILKSSISELKTEVSDLRSEVNLLNKQRLSNVTPGEVITIEQQQLNSNIIIRGVELEESQCESESEPLKVFNKICAHLGITDEEEFKPVLAKVFPAAKTNIESKANRTIQVRLRSISAKRNFLQIRRVRKDILPSDIGLSQKSKKGILITEQLTKVNQELLYAARSLRHTHRYKFVWSNNGQILARPSQQSKVIRIKSIDHINELRSNINLEPFSFPNYERLLTRSTIEANQSNPEV